MTIADRRSPCFAESVESSFGFLAGYGFRRVQTEATFVRYESPELHVNIYHGRRSYELHLEFGPRTGLPSGEPSYYMAEILDLVNPDERARYRPWATHTVHGVAEGVRELASLFRQALEHGMMSEPRLFERLQEKRAEWRERFALDVELTHARERVDAAWHAKDYAKVVELLEPLRQHLSPSELAKLEYAKKRASGS